MSIGAWQSFKKSWTHQASMQIATLSVLLGSFTVLSISALVQQNLSKILSTWGSEVKINVYLQDDIQDQDKDKISHSLEGSGLFSKVRYFSKKEAAEEFKKRVGQYAPGLLSDLEFDNPLPASFAMVVSGGLNSSFKFENIVNFAKDLERVTGVEEVSYGQGWVENYASVLNVFSLTSAVFLFVLLSGSLFVIGNSIRNAISQRRDEIAILELFGATRKMIIWPYIFEGLFMGLVAAIGAVILTYAVFLWQMDLIANHLSFLNLNAKLEYLSVGRQVGIVLIGTLLGGLGSYLWARKVTTGWAAAEAVER